MRLCKEGGKTSTMFSLTIDNQLFVILSGVEIGLVIDI